MKAWTSAVTQALNSQNTEIAALRKLLVHSISQNNVLGTFSTSVIRRIEERLVGIETSIAATPGHKGPLASSSDQKETLASIAHKVASIEDKVTAIIRNPPGLVSQKPNPTPQRPPVEEPRTQPAPPAPTASNPAPTVSWYENDARNGSTDMLRVWAAMINVGKWGLPKKEGTVEIVPKYEVAERPALTDFILQAARYHIKDRNGGAFISPPQNQMIIRDRSWVK